MLASAQHSFSFSLNADLEVLDPFEHRYPLVVPLIQGCGLPQIGGVQVGTQVPEIGEYLHLIIECFPYRLPQLISRPIS